MTDWIKWSGGECPVDQETMVEIACRGGLADEGLAGGSEIIRRMGKELDGLL